MLAGIIGMCTIGSFAASLFGTYTELVTLCCLLCRSRKKADRIRREYGIPVTTDVRVCENARPDFVVVAVDRDSKFAVTKQWLEKGCAVLSETPAGLTADELEEMWAPHQRGARLQIAEQYIRYPLIAAGLRAFEGISDYNVSALFKSSQSAGPEGIG